MSIGIRYKDPAATLDYSFIWTAWLTASETIASSAWAISPNDATLTIATQTLSIHDTTVWLSAGTLGVTYTITNTIHTNSGTPRIDERSFQLTIRNQ